jgi:hypothetical protein
MPPLIELYLHEGVGVILLCQSGVRYTNETGGYMCLHQEAEGAYLPLGVGSSTLALELNEHFETKWVGWCHDGIDEETAHFVDGLLAAQPETTRFQVDRQRLADSHEAWIHVRLLKPDEAERPSLDIISGFPEENPRVLTGGNSD